MRTTSRARIAALAFGLSLIGVPAFAADDQNGRDRHDQDQATPQDQQDDEDSQGNKGKHKGQYRNQNQNQNPNTAPPGGMNPSGYQNNNANSNDNDRDRTRGRGDADYNTNTNTNDRDRDRTRNTGRGDADYNTNRDRDRNWGNDRRSRSFDITRYRRNFQSPTRFRIGIYHAPRGYYYRRWHYGQRLPIIFYARDYWLLDYIAFGLFAPPPGFVWVRYGPDALLIDVETGEIIQVRYDVFYS